MLLNGKEGTEPEVKTTERLPNPNGIVATLQHGGWQDERVRESTKKEIATLRTLKWTSAPSEKLATNDDASLARNLIKVLPLARGAWCDMQRQINEYKKDKPTTTRIPAWLTESEEIVLAFIEELEKLEKLFGKVEEDTTPLPTGPAPTIQEILDGALATAEATRRVVGAEIVPPDVKGTTRPAAF